MTLMAPNLAFMPKFHASISWHKWLLDYLHYLFDQMVHYCKDHPPCSLP